MLNQKSIRQLDQELRMDTKYLVLFVVFLQFLSVVTKDYSTYVAAALILILILILVIDNSYVIKRDYLKIWNILKWIVLLLGTLMASVG